MSTASNKPFPKPRRLFRSVKGSSAVVTIPPSQTNTVIVISRSKRNGGRINVEVKGSILAALIDGSRKSN